MSKVGRNDPCPCGSGKKYKKCHLASDEAAASERLKYGPVALNDGNSTHGEDVEDWDEDDGNDKLISLPGTILKQFQAAGAGGKADWVRNLLENPDMADRDFLSSFFWDLEECVEKNEDRESVLEIIAILKGIQPERYREIAPELLEFVLRYAFARGDNATVASRFLEAITFSSEPLIPLMDWADEFAFRNLGKPLVEGFRIAWSRAKSTDGAAVFEIEEYLAWGADCEIFHHLDQGLAGDDPGLEERVRFFLSREELDLPQYLNQIRRQDTDWPREAFAVDRKAAKEGGPDWERFQREWKALTNAFLGFLNREKGIPWLKAELMRRGIRSYLTGRLSGALKFDRGRKGSPVYWEDKVVKALCPDAFTLGHEFDVLLEGYPRQEFQAAAMHEGLPHWLEFLGRSGLVEDGILKEIFASLLPVLEKAARLTDTPFPLEQMRSNP